MTDSDEHFFPCKLELLFPQYDFKMESWCIIKELRNGHFSITHFGGLFHPEKARKRALFISDAYYHRLFFFFFICIRTILNKNLIYGKRNSETSWNDNKFIIVKISSLMNKFHKVPSKDCIKLEKINKNFTNQLKWNISASKFEENFVI